MYIYQPLADTKTKCTVKLGKLIKGKIINQTHFINKFSQQRIPAAYRTCRKHCLIVTTFIVTSSNHKTLEEWASCPFCSVTEVFFYFLRQFPNFLNLAVPQIDVFCPKWAFGQSMCPQRARLIGPSDPLVGSSATLGTLNLEVTPMLKLTLCDTPLCFHICLLESLFTPLVKVNVHVFQVCKLLYICICVFLHTVPMCVTTH